MGPRVITIDTSGIMALVNRLDPNHAHAEAALRRQHGDFFIPVGVLTEMGYMIERKLGQRALQLFLADLVAGAYELDCATGDLPRVVQLTRRYADLPLGMADAMVIACAERHGGRVLTFDHRHFGVVGREGTITIVP